MSLCRYAFVAFGCCRRRRRHDPSLQLLRLSSWTWVALQSSTAWAPDSASFMLNTAVFSWLYQTGNLLLHGQWSTCSLKDSPRSKARLFHHPVGLWFLSV
eukprot:s5473_g6.t1